MENSSPTKRNYTSFKNGGGVVYDSNSSPAASIKRRYYGIAGRSGSSESRRCHQCQRISYGRVLYCNKCDTRSYCLRCVTQWYPQMNEEDFIVACPVCRDNCNCTSCLRVEFPLNDTTRFEINLTKDDKLHHSKYLLKLLLPFVRRFNEDQIREREMEAKIQGLSLSEVKLQVANCDVDDRLYCNNCKTSISQPVDVIALNCFDWCEVKLNIKKLFKGYMEDAVYVLTHAKEVTVTPSQLAKINKLRKRHRVQDQRELYMNGQISDGVEAQMESNDVEELENADGVQQVFHPIHDRAFYLSSEHKKRLKKDYGIEPWTVVQNLGDAVFVPAGCPCQVRNLKSCITVSTGFVSPENVDECIRLSEEIRVLPQNHRAKEDKLEVKKLILHAMRKVLDELDEFTNVKSQNSSCHTLSYPIKTECVDISSNPGYLGSATEFLLSSSKETFMRSALKPSVIEKSRNSNLSKKGWSLDLRLPINDGTSSERNIRKEPKISEEASSAISNRQQAPCSDDTPEFCSQTSTYLDPDFEVYGLNLYEVTINIYLDSLAHCPGECGAPFSVQC
ncbi:hypothetical protein POM88_001286 [Heracleum sosnowskyi]|uniref:Uncharacterized protein n=1 Tax=Heracleum sosnowskyi TaxID=360622 RepID=A0AAD8JFI9_9APIA|nr:hypothetical protein POM88_001286 [Heracleum sosnowskyi]